MMDASAALPIIDRLWWYASLAATGIVTEEATPLIGGLAAHDGHIQLVLAALSTAVGVWGAGILLYWIGRWRGGWVRQRFPTIAEACRSVGLDLATDRIPVGPAAHYVMGGVETDLWGRTTLLGLYAAGEVACTGVHGANRLASNSLLEGLVFGARASQAMLLPGEDVAPFSILALGADDAATLRAPRDGGQTPSEEDVRSLMWNAVGLLRDGAGLQIAIERLDAWYAALGADRGRIASLVTVGRLMAHAALRREETRGGHARADFRRRDDVKFRIHFGERIH